MKDKFKVPFSKSKRNSLAIDLALDARIAGDKANKARTISDFIQNYDIILESFEKLSKMNGRVTSVKGNLLAEYYRFRSEFQKHFHDAIERSGNQIISDKNGLYKYDDSFIEQSIKKFKTDIDTYLSRGDKDNQTFAKAKYSFVCHECRMQYLLSYPDNASPEPQHHNSSFSVDDEMYIVDCMEGHEFEAWCAGILEQNGFLKTTVTRGSGDQGVDVLAEKDGIKYAIQCKCYSSDLGNTPVQEVNAGKTIYHCHVGVVMTNRFFTSGAKQAAEATGVLLWDRNKIEEFILNAGKGKQNVETKDCKSCF